jgi:hypothetical protein
MNSLIFFIGALLVAYYFYNQNTRYEGFSNINNSSKNNYKNYQNNKNNARNTVLKNKKNNLPPKPIKNTLPVAPSNHQTNNDNLNGIRINGNSDNEYASFDQSYSLQNGIPSDIANGKNYQTNFNMNYQPTTSQDLLPKDNNNTWAELNPTGSGSLQNVQFLNPSVHLGVNSQGQSRRNANYQIRSDIPNPQVQVSPWGQSTIEPDTNIRKLEI